LKSWVCYLLLSFLLLNGCTARDTSYDLRKDRSAPQFMSNQNRTNNVINVENTTISPRITNDVDRARRIVTQTKEFQPNTVWINGDRMWVTAFKKGILAEKERTAAEARLHRILVQAFPKYHIEVSVKEDRR
jgi:hypothetical protein